MIARWGSVVINTTDPDRLVEFWSRVLGVTELHRVPGFVFLEAQDGNRIKLAFQQVPDPTPGPRRLHLDFGVPNVEEATRKILEIGGSHLDDHSWGEFKWRVMADPDGNEFCIGEIEGM